MIFSNRRFPRAILAMAIAWITLLGSCSSGDDSNFISIPDRPVDITPEDGKVCNMGIYLRLGQTQDVSRGGSRTATPPVNGHYNPGSGYENYIHLSGGNPDVRVYLFSVDDKLIAWLPTPMLSVVESTDSYTTYELVFRVDKVLENADSGVSFKVVVLANWRDYPAPDGLKPGVTTIADLVGCAEGVGGYNPSPAVLDTDSRIPFFGVSQYDNVTFVPDKVTYADDTPLWLLRAYAKIEVWDDASTEEFIKSVQLIRHNTRAYKAPLGVTHQDDYVRFDYDNDRDFVIGPSLPADNAAWEISDPMTVQKRDADGHFVAYVPEYRNIGRNEADRSYLKVIYKDGNTFTIPFIYRGGAPANVAIGDPYDIVRNYWYQFECKRNASDIEWSVDVMPYGEVVLEPDFGIKP